MREARHGHCVAASSHPVGAIVDVRRLSTAVGHQGLVFALALDARSNESLGDAKWLCASKSGTIVSMRSGCVRMAVG